jgi:alcohol dehydrogenase, propanol-preferring
MLAYRIVEWEQPPRLVDVPVPEPGPGQVLVKVAGNGLCHSDATMSLLPGSLGEPLGWRVPFTLGHEIGGWIAAVGSGVPGGVTGLAEGDPVALVSPSSDGTCDYCLRGQDSACPNGLVGRGYGQDGGLAEYVLVGSTRPVIKLSTLDPVAVGPLTDAGATSFHAVKRVRDRLEPGSTAVVIGAGGLGSFAVQHLRAASAARVVAVDTNPARLAYATELGAHHTLEGVTPDTVADLHELTGGEGAAAVLDFVGTDETVAAGVASVRPYGAYGCIGAGGGTLRAPWYGGLPRDGEVFNFQGSCISDARDVIALADAGLIRSDVDVFPLDRVEEAYGRLEAGELRGRAVVVPG